MALSKKTRINAKVDRETRALFRKANEATSTSTAKSTNDMLGSSLTNGTMTICSFKTVREFHDNDAEYYWRVREYLKVEHGDPHSATLLYQMVHAISRY